MPGKAALTAARSTGLSSTKTQLCSVSESCAPDRVVEIEDDDLDRVECQRGSPQIFDLTENGVEKFLDAIFEQSIHRRHRFDPIGLVVMPIVVENRAVGREGKDVVQKKALA